MKKSSLTIFALLFLFSVNLAAGPSSWPCFHPNYGQTNLVVQEHPVLCWQVALGDSVQVYNTTSPIVGWIGQEEVVYLGTSQGLYCLAADSGTIICSRPTAQSIQYAPAYADTNRLYVPSGDSLLCFNPTNGQRLWGYQCSDKVFHVVNLGNDVGVIDASANVYVFSSANYQLRWHAGPLSSGGCDNTSLIMDNERCVYAVTLGNPLSYFDFAFYKLGLDSGNVIWSDQELFWEPAGIRLTPGLRPNNQLCFATCRAEFWGSSIYNFDASNHQMTWRRSFTYPDGAIYASPAIDVNGYTYFPLATGLVGLDDSNQQRWRYNFLINASSPVVNGDHKIIFGTADGYLTILDHGGAVLESDSCGGDLTSPAIGGDGSIYIANSLGTVYKYDDEVVGQKEEWSPVAQINALKIYPNPFVDRLTIATRAFVTIYAMDGRLVFRGQAPLTWPTSQLPEGLYLVKLDGRQGIKLVKD